MVYGFLERPVSRLKEAPASLPCSPCVPCSLAEDLL